MELQLAAVHMDRGPYVSGKEDTDHTVYLLTNSTVSQTASLFEIKRLETTSNSARGTVPTVQAAQC